MLSITMHLRSIAIDHNALVLDRTVAQLHSISLEWVLKRTIETQKHKELIAALVLLCGSDALDHKGHVLDRTTT